MFVRSHARTYERDIDKINNISHNCLSLSLILIE